MHAIIVHGGAGDWPNRSKDPLALAGVSEAAEAGRAILAAGGTALDASVAAVVALEDNPIFNAGTGSCLNINGEIEMDAIVMDGVTMETGAVANLRRVRHPVQVARKVMEETDHCLLGGQGALAFARTMGFEDYDPQTPRARRIYEKRIKGMREGTYNWLPRLRKLLQRHPDLYRGTVGAVAVDDTGRTAAATSTGGVTLKLEGRIGDTPVPGAGNYATARGASSATGRGELMMRFLTTRVVCDLMDNGAPAPEACHRAMAHMATTVGADAGIICVDAQGRVGAAHGSSHMPHAWLTKGMSEAKSRMVAKNGPVTGD
jgi:beta-aspartyl-peptidase (threonine type)